MSNLPFRAKRQLPYLVRFEEQGQKGGWQGSVCPRFPMPSLCFLKFHPSYSLLFSFFLLFCGLTSPLFSPPHLSSPPRPSPVLSLSVHPLSPDYVPGTVLGVGVQETFSPGRTQRCKQITTSESGKCSDGSKLREQGEGGAVST